MSSFDAAVIGSGPAGVTAALYLVRSGCSVILFEKMAAGGQILQTEALENYPGYPKGIKGYELADLFAAHLEGLPVTHSRDAVESVSGEAGNFVVRAGGKEHSCRTVIVCSGAHHRELGLADEKRLQGRGVSYCALCDGNFFRDQVVAVVGGGNSALEEALYRDIKRRDELDRQAAIERGMLPTGSLKEGNTAWWTSLDELPFSLDGKGNISFVVRRFSADWEQYVVPPWPPPGGAAAAAAGLGAAGAGRVDGSHGGDAG